MNNEVEIDGRAAAANRFSSVAQWECECHATSDDLEKILNDFVELGYHIHSVIWRDSEQRYTIITFFYQDEV